MTYYKWKGHAELVFGNYLRNKSLLRMYDDNAIFGKHGDEGMPHSTQPGDPTGSAAVSIAQNPRVVEIEREVKAVERVLAQLPPNQAEFIRFALMRKGHTIAGSATLYEMCDRTGIRWKKNACLLLAFELGWVDKQ